MRRMWGKPASAARRSAPSRNQLTLEPLEGRLVLNHGSVFVVDDYMVAPDVAVSNASWPTSVESSQSTRVDQTVIVDPRSVGRLDATASPMRNDWGQGSVSSYAVENSPVRWQATPWGYQTTRLDSPFVIVVQVTYSSGSYAVPPAAGALSSMSPHDTLHVRGDEYVSLAAVASDAGMGPSGPGGAIPPGGPPRGGPVAGVFSIANATAATPTTPASNVALLAPVTANSNSALPNTAPELLTEPGAQVRRDARLPATEEVAVPTGDEASSAQVAARGADARGNTASDVPAQATEETALVSQVRPAAALLSAASINLAAVDRALADAMAEVERLGVGLGAWCDELPVSDWAIAGAGVVVLGAGGRIALRRRGKDSPDEEHEEASTQWLFTRLQTNPGQP